MLAGVTRTSRESLPPLTYPLPCPHPSGNLLRSEIQSETELGLIAKEQMEKGELLPDELMIALVRPSIPCHAMPCPTSEIVPMIDRLTLLLPFVQPLGR